MKTILVDAWNTFVTGEGINNDLYNFLEKYENSKIIVTNANEEQKTDLGIINMPYPVYSLSHNPDKDNVKYFEKFFEENNLDVDSVVYFEHNIDAVNTGKSLGIPTFHYQKGENNIEGLENFFNENL